MSVWFVTGASRGFGAEIVDQALAAGHQVIATARDPRAVTSRFPDSDDHLLAVALDVTDAKAAEVAVESAVQRFGRIDIVVNNAGRGLLSAVEEASDAAARAVYDTSVFGVLNVLRAVLPVLRTQRSLSGLPCTSTTVMSDILARTSARASKRRTGCRGYLSGRRGAFDDEGRQTSTRPHSSGRT